MPLCQCANNPMGIRVLWLGIRSQTHPIQFSGTNNQTHTLQVVANYQFSEEIKQQLIDHLKEKQKSCQNQEQILG